MAETPNAAPRVVIVGAGFAGLEVAKGLAGTSLHVTLVDQRNYNTFQPLLYQVASSGLDEGDVAHAIRPLFEDSANIDVRLDTVTGLDRDHRELVCVDGDRLPFDFLVLAAGATTNYFNVAGAEEYAFPLYTLGHAIALRNHVLQCFERSDVDTSLIEDGSLNVVIVGGGPTGVETAGALSELFHKVMARGYRHIRPGQARVILVEQRDMLLAPFRERSQAHARATLVKLGVNIRLGESVSEVTARSVRLATGDELPAQTVVWTAGVQPSPLGQALELPLEQNGRVRMNPDLSVRGDPGIFVVGDLAGARQRDGSMLPQLAPVAMQAGRHVAAQVQRRIAGRATKPFRYHDKGTMATIGRRAAVADLPFGITLGGTLAWLAWLLLHLLYLIGFQNRTQVLIQWSWNYLTWDWGPRLILEPEDRRARDATRAGASRPPTPH